MCSQTESFCGPVIEVYMCVRGRVYVYVRVCVSGCVFAWFSSSSTSTSVNSGRLLIMTVWFPSSVCNCTSVPSLMVFVTHEGCRSLGNAWTSMKTPTCMCFLSHVLSNRIRPGPSGHWRVYVFVYMRVRVYVYAMCMALLFRRLVWQLALKSIAFEYAFEYVLNKCASDASDSSVAKTLGDNTQRLCNSLVSDIAWNVWFCGAGDMTSTLLLFKQFNRTHTQHLQVHTASHSDAYIRIRTHTRTYTHTHMHTYTHTHTHLQYIHDCGWLTSTCVLSSHKCLRIGSVCLYFYLLYCLCFVGLCFTLWL